MSENAQSARPARGASIVNLGLAAIAAGSLGFLVFAMPEDVFSDLVVRTGLPAYLPAAEPPLGMKARGGVIAAVALLVFAVVLLILRGIDRLSARPAAAAARPAEPEGEAPRLRRADAHPDAPAPRPILAGRDLGGFADADEYDYPPEPDDDEMFADLPAQPLPGFLTAGRAAEETGEAHFESAPLEASEDAPAFEPAAIEPEAFEEPVAGQADHEEEPLILDTPADERSIEAMVSRLPEAEEVEDNSIASLMRRLETGLERREEEAETGEPEPVLEEPVSAAPSWLAPQPLGDERESEEVEASGEYDALEPSAPPPSWLAPQAEAEQPFEAEQPIEAEQAWEAEEADQAEEAEEAPAAFAPRPIVPAAVAFPEVDEFGEPARPAPPAGEPQFAPLGAAHRAQPLKVQALPPQPVQSAPAEVEAPGEMSIGRRLRSAIADMDKIASSGGA